jgi:hypothetical protein
MLYPIASKLNVKIVFFYYSLNELDAYIQRYYDTTNQLDYKILLKI